MRVLLTHAHTHIYFLLQLAVHKEHMCNIDQWIAISLWTKTGCMTLVIDYFYMDMDQSVISSRSIITRDKTKLKWNLTGIARGRVVNKKMGSSSSRRERERERSALEWVEVVRQTLGTLASPWWALVFPGPSTSLSLSIAFAFTSHAQTVKLS